MSRHLRSHDSEKLASKLNGSPFPSKKWLEKLTGMDEKQFESGQLLSTSKSKNVYRQVSYENRKQACLDDDQIKRSNNEK